MIERYEEYLKYELNYSNYTIKEYIIHVKEFLFYCDENKIDYLKVTIVTPASPSPYSPKRYSFTYFNRFK